MWLYNYLKCSRQDDGTFARILLDVSETDSHRLLDGSEVGGPYPFSLYQKKHQSREPFVQARDDAATIGWLNDRTAILLNISWEGGEGSWPKEWLVPAVGASFKATISGTKARISDVHLLGPMDSDDLVRLVRSKYARELKQ